MEGLPVTIRLLDPPLHEFIPNAEELAQEVERARIEESDDLEELEHTLERVHVAGRDQPDARHARRAAGRAPPGDLRDADARDRARRARRARGKTGESPLLEVMVPLVTYEQELELMRELLERVAEEEGGGDLDLLIGTMIELPRACFVADRIAAQADFFSFGTNDLTQTALGFSRDDVGGMLARYLDLKIVDRNPFETIDTPGRRLAGAAGGLGRP